MRIFGIILRSQYIISLARRGRELCEYMHEKNQTSRLNATIPLGLNPKLDSYLKLCSLVSGDGHGIWRQLEKAEGDFILP